MKKKLLLLTAMLCSLIFHTVSFAKDVSKTSTGWYDGMVVLNDKTIVKGALNYDYKHDLVMCRREGKIATFTPFQLASFMYLDHDTRIVHRFITLKQQKSSYAKLPSIFEVVLKGDIQYLRKHNQYPPVRSHGNPALYMEPFYQEQIDCYDYYILYQNNLTKSGKFDKEVLPQLEVAESTLSAYIREQGLRTYNIGDQIKLIQYLNTMDKTDRYVSL